MDRPHPPTELDPGAAGTAAPLWHTFNPTVLLPCVDVSLKLQFFRVVFLQYVADCATPVILLNCQGFTAIDAVRNPA